jgi:6-pyruvoyl-tetrahydropterin synthase-like protein
MSESPRPLSTGSSKHRLREWGLAAMVSVCVSLAVLAPCFRLGTASGHDVAFHMASWLDAAGQWKEGTIFPRWTEWANFGFGEPRFIFYPPLSWLFGAFLGTILPWPSVAAVLIGCVQTFAGLSAYALFRRIADSRLAALLAASCFAANPYSLLIIYMRSDFAELLAIAISPLLMLAAFRLIGLVHSEESGRYSKIVLFAIPLCAVWLSNAPAGVIATYSVAFMFLMAAVRQRSVAVLTAGACGMGLGFALAAFYLIPAVYEQRWVQISAALYGGLTPADNFLYAKTSDVEHDAFNRIASHLATLLILWTVCAAIAAWRGGSLRRAGTPKSEVFMAMLALSAVAIVLMLPISNIFWRYLPELRFVQFPWRCMAILALGAIMFTVSSARGRMGWVWLLFAALAIFGSAHYLVKHAWWDTEDMPALQAAIQGGAGFEGTDEYDPAGDDHGDLQQKLPRAFLVSDAGKPEAGSNGKIVIEQWTAEHRSVRVFTAKPDGVELRLLNYPAWRVTVNGSAVSLRRPEGSGQMMVPVSAGESELRVDFTRTSDRVLGGWISILSAVTSLSLLFCQRRPLQSMRV